METSDCASQNFSVLLRKMNSTVIRPIRVVRESPFRWPRLAQICASAGCTRDEKRWNRLFARSMTIKVRGSTFCFPNCFERELQRELDRSSGTNPPSSSKNRRIPIGLLMLSRGSLTNEQLGRALNQQRESGYGRLGEWFTRMGFARETDITAALAVQWSCPLLRKLPLHVEACGIPMHLLQAFRMLPIHFSRAARMLHIAFADEIAYPALVSLEQMLDVKTEACLTTQTEINSALGRMKETKGRPEKVFENLCGPQEIVPIVSGFAGKLHASELRMVICGNYYWARILGPADDIDLIFSRQKIHLDEVPEAV
jgi:hypothetical protein